VYEWCADRYAPYVTADLVDPVATAGFQRVFRGGCFLEAAESCRSAFRSGLAPWAWGRGTGFRVALPAEGGTVDPLKLLRTVRATCFSRPPGGNVRCITFKRLDILAPAWNGKSAPTVSGGRQRREWRPAP